MELIYALQNKLLYADVKNAEGAYVKPSLESVTAALSTATIPDDFRFSFVNAPGKTSYPIAGVTWLLVYEQQKTADKGKKLVAFLKWLLNDGEKMATALDYASLPDNVRDRVLKAVDTIKGLTAAFRLQPRHSVPVSAPAVATALCCRVCSGEGARPRGAGATAGVTNDASFPEPLLLIMLLPIT